MQGSLQHSIDKASTTISFSSEDAFPSIVSDYSPSDSLSQSFQTLTMRLLTKDFHGKT